MFVNREGDGYRFDGQSTGVEEGVMWGLRYEVALDDRWRTRAARVVARTGTGARELRLERNEHSVWRVDGAPAPHLAGCEDVDLEASGFTNALPAHRLGLAVGEAADAPAAWVRTQELKVERLEQRYERLADGSSGPRYSYSAPDLGFATVITHDEHGLVLQYPGIAVRVA